MSDLDNLQQKVEAKLSDKTSLAELIKEVEELKKIISEILNKLKTRNF
jgi:hypothetical protein